ncbi:MAG: LamG domain-containing protein [Verrucomicrobiota bacterium]
MKHPRLRGWQLIPVLLFSAVAVNAANLAPVAWWTFDNETARDQVSGRLDALTGHHGWAEGVRGRALRSDEFATVIERPASGVPAFTNGGFTVEAWIAPRTFPWNYCPIMTQRDAASGFYFGINYQGQLQLQAAVGGKWVCCESRTALPGLHEGLRFAGEGGDQANTAHFGNARPDPSIPLLKWTHVAGTVSTNGTLRLYLNGEPAGETNAGGGFLPASGEKLVIGRTQEPVLPLFLARPANNAPHFCSFDGLLDEIKMYDRALSSAEVKEEFQGVHPATPQPLQFRRMPTAQDQPGAFGAFYTRFAYDEDWDRTRRFGEDQDVFVRFADNPCTLVCWNGTMYPVFYPDGGNIGQQFEAFETWDKDGCHEAMMDRRSEHSSWRIIENSPACVVLHWRHALVSYNGNYINTDTNTGWSDWVDDYYTVYPDAVYARRTTLWSSTPVSNHSYAQDNSVIQPGLMPWDVYEEEPLTVANLDGQETVMTMGEGNHGPKDATFKGPAVIQRHNFRTKWKPFMIAPPDEAFGGPWTNPEPWPWFLPCWHHWPAAQLIDSDGSITFVENGRPKSSCLTQGWGYGSVHTNAVVITENSLTRFALAGMTDGSAAALASLARSWRQPPTATVTSAGYRSEGYQLGERAYRFARLDTRAPAQLELQVKASPASPLVHPAFVVENWNAPGEIAATWNGRELAREDFRQGFRVTPTGTNLVIWLNRSTETPADIRFAVRPSGK